MFWTIKTFIVTLDVPSNPYVRASAAHFPKLLFTNLNVRNRCVFKGQLTQPPQIWVGYVCQFFAIEIFCQSCQRMAKYAIFINKFDQKYITKGSVCQFWGPHNAGKHTFYENMCAHEFGLPGPLQTAFELNKKYLNLRKQKRPMRLHLRFMPLIS